MAIQPPRVNDPYEGAGTPANDNIKDALQNAKDAANSDDSVVTIPDVGSEKVETGLRGARDTVREEVKSGREEILKDTPEYVKPSDEKLDTIEGPEKYERDENTVAWQMDQLLNKESPYMQAAQTKADEQAQRFGMMGSSMAAGASQRAAIETALPIATSDATTAATFSQNQQTSENAIGVVEAETELASSLMTQRVALENQQTALQESFALAATGLDQEGQAVLLDQQSRWSYVTQDAGLRLEGELNQKLVQQQIDADTVASVRENAAQLVLNNALAAEKLLSDPDLLQLGSEAIADKLNILTTVTANSMQFLADSSNVNMDDYIDDFIDNNTFEASDVGDTTVPDPDPDPAPDPEDNPDDGEAQGGTTNTNLTGPISVLI